MDRNQRLNIIVKALTLPLCELSFRQEDLLAHRAQCFALLQRGGPERQKETARYHALQERLLDLTAARCRVERLDDLRELLELYYPNDAVARRLTFRRGAARADGAYLTRVLDVTRELVTQRDGRLSIRMWENSRRDELLGSYSGLSKVEIWNTLARTVTPDLFLAAYYADAGIGDIEYLTGLPANLSMNDRLADQILRQGVAETHLHANAGMNYLSLWEAATDVTEIDFTLGSLPPEEEQLLPFLCGLIRLFVAELIERADGPGAAPGDLTPEGGFPLSRDVLSLALSEDPPAEWLRSVAALYERFRRGDEPLRALRMRYGDPPPGAALDLLGRWTYRRYLHLHTSCELLFLYRVLSFLRQNPECPNLTGVFLNYLRMKNTYFANKLQTPSIKGLHIFRRYFDKASGAMRKNRFGGNSKKEAVYLSLFRDQGHSGRLVKLEMKISPVYSDRIVSAGPPEEVKLQGIKGRIAEQLLDVFRAYAAYIDESLAGPGDRLPPPLGGGERLVPTVGIVYHFIKHENLDRLKGDFCWVNEDSVERRSSDYVETLRKRYMEFLDGLADMIRDVPYLGEYVVGIDAASDELGTDPWVFAPVYHYARRKCRAYPIQRESGRYQQNLGLTYHVGEDYRHLLSGLRHVDEVLDHFGYKAGDRLGHALCLQVDADQWAASNEVVMMPQMEYLENLLWLWKVSGQLPQEGLLAAGNLEKRIMDLARKIYENVIGLSPFVLLEAYTKKFRSLSPEKVRKIREYYLDDGAAAGAERLTGARPPVKRSFCRLYPKHGNMPIDQIWDEDKLLLTHFCPCYIRHYNQPVFVRTSREEAALLRAAQAFVKRKVQENGIYVELNPTSNATIGDLGGILEDTMLGLHPLGRQGETQQGSFSLMLSVNADDPLVFSTNVENEIATVYHMLVHHKHSREEVLAFIDRVRQCGIDSSFVRAAKPPGTLREEVRKILRSLEEMAHVEHRS